MLFLLGCSAVSENPKPATHDSAIHSEPGNPTEAWGELYGWTPQNVVLVHVDTLRADHLPFYGYSRNTLPSLYGRSGWVVQKRHYASASWTWPSTATLLTGLEPYVHGVMLRPSDNSVIQVQGGFFPEWIQGQGVHTAYFDGNADLLSTSLVEGWEQSVVNGVTIASAVALETDALGWVDTIPKEERFFLMVQPMDPHAPRRPMTEDMGTWVDYSGLPFTPENTDEEQAAAVQAVIREGDQARIDRMAVELNNLYDEELLGLDRGIEALLKGLEERGRLEDTLVVVTADHGESIFDVGTTFGHGGTLREELIRVPLLFYNPRFGDRSIEGCLTANRSLLPTLTKAMALEAMPDTQGSAFQDCDASVASSLFRDVDGEQRWYLNLEATDVRLEVDCKEGKLTGYDLRTDPAALKEVEGNQLLKFNPGLLDVLKSYSEAVSLARPEFPCSTDYH